MRNGPLATAVVAATLFWAAYDNGSYSFESWSVLAIAVLWGLAVAVIFGLAPRARIPTSPFVVGGLIASLALWTLASLLWSADAEATFEEFDRVALYLATFVSTALISSSNMVGRFADGLAAAIVAVAALALISRFFPGSFPEGDLPTFLPQAVTRLSFPLGYWNGLAIFVALGIPLLLRVVLVARGPAIRSLALVPMPAIAAVIYLTSSRGGVLVALVGAGVFLVLTGRRGAAALAIALSLIGSAAAIAILLGRDQLANGPLGTELVESQGRSAALLLTLVCGVTGLSYWGGWRLLRDKTEPPALGWALLAASVSVAIVAVAAASPVEQFDGFKKLPSESEAIDRDDFAQAHLLSGSGSGRWQFWAAAVDQWKDHQLLGAGAGSFEAWWAQHASFSYFVKDAHSLYLETLGELGVVGFVLVLALVVAGIVVGVLRARGASGDLRVNTAALAAVFAAYAAGVSLDWMWELAVVSLVAFAALGLVSGAGTVASGSLRVAEPGERRPRTYRRFGLGVVALVTIWALICAQAIPLLARLEIGKSQDAVGRRDIDDAMSAAEAARAIQPWAATPYLQLALVNEEAGELGRARSWLREALVRDRRDWRLWLVAARIETKLGNVAAGERSLRRAAALNPRSPLFEGVFEP